MRELSNLEVDKACGAVVGSAGIDSSVIDKVVGGITVLGFTSVGTGGSWGDFGGFSSTPQFSVMTISGIADSIPKDS